jgi:hypothetical protein
MRRIGCGDSSGGHFQRDHSRGLFHRRCKHAGAATQGMKPSAGSAGTCGQRPDQTAVQLFPSVIASHSQLKERMPMLRMNGLAL